MDATLRVELCEEGADAERLDTLTSYLRAELLRLDIADVTTLKAGPPPPGARAFDVATIGALLVAIGPSAHAIGPIISTVIGWLKRGDKARRAVRMEIAGDVLELADATETDQQRLIELFVTRHSMKGSEPWTTPEKP